MRCVFGGCKYNNYVFRSGHPPKKAPRTKNTLIVPQQLNEHKRGQEMLAEGLINAREAREAGLNPKYDEALNARSFGYLAAASAEADDDQGLAEDLTCEMFTGYLMQTREAVRTATNSEYVALEAVRVECHTKQYLSVNCAPKREMLLFISMCQSEVWGYSM